ncbi:MAG: hypothetical protein ACO3N7_01980 [Kiritimatiellia bacterium]
MKTPNYCKTILLLISGAFLFLSAPLYAQDESGEEAVEEAGESAGLTQGQAAVIVARRLRILSGNADATQAGAALALSARGIQPKGGWDLGSPLAPADLALILVQALGLEDEFSPEQLAAEDPQPLYDLLEARFGVNVQEIVSGGQSAGGGIQDNQGQLGTVDASSDPLEGADIPEGERYIPVTEEVLDRVLEETSVGQAPGTGAGNITPSGP